MIILAMDTTAKTAAAALLDGEKLLAKDAREGQGAHSAALLPMIEDLFSRTGIGSDGVDLYAASAGPGSFTGVRIGARVVGYGLACDLADVFLSSPFEGGRHQTRIDMIAEIEKDR